MRSWRCLQSSNDVSERPKMELEAATHSTKGADCRDVRLSSRGGWGGSLLVFGGRREGNEGVGVGVATTGFGTIGGGGGGPAGAELVAAGGRVAWMAGGGGFLLLGLRATVMRGRGALLELVRDMLVLLLAEAVAGVLASVGGRVELVDATDSEREAD